MRINAPKLNETQKQGICDRYFSGEKARDLSEIYGIAPTNIYALLKKRSVPINGQPGSNRRRGRHSVDAQFFSRIDSDEDSAYWAGFLAADGSVGKNGSVTLSLAARDYNHLLLFKKHCCAEHPIGKQLAKSSSGQFSESVRLTVTSKDWVQSLEKLSIVNRKTFTLTFPEMPLEAQRHFMRGYFDGDGCWHRTKRGGVCFDVLGTKQFLEVFREILIRECGCFCPEVRKVKGIYGLRVNGWNNCASIAAFLYRDSTVYLERKRDKVKEIAEPKTAQELESMRVERIRKRAAARAQPGKSREKMDCRW